MDELLANPEVEVVGIYTPDHLHAEHVIQALRAGKHVICTKPFVNNLSRAKEILAAQQQSGKRVMIGQSSRFFAPFARQRKHFETGAFGDIITIEAYYNADHRWFLKKGWAKDRRVQMAFWRPEPSRRSHALVFAGYRGSHGLLVTQQKRPRAWAETCDTFQFIFKSPAEFPRASAALTTARSSARTRQQHELHSPLRQRRQPGRLL